MRQINKVLLLLVIISTTLFSPEVSLAAYDGAGTMSSSPISVVEGSTNNDFTFHFTNPSPNTDFGGSSKLNFTIPSPWISPQKTNASNAGYVTIANTTCGNSPENGGNDITVSGRTLTIKIDQCNTNDTFDLLYKKVNAPAVGAYTFTTATQEGSSGMTNIAVSPQVSVLDVTAPVISEVTKIDALTNDLTPSYVFNTNEAGTIVYTGSCGVGDKVNATVGNNTITFGPLASGTTYSDCTIKVTDASLNSSNFLNIPTFKVDADVFDKAMVTLSFDDGYKTTYDVGAPILDAASIKGTMYIVADYAIAGYSRYMKLVNVVDLFNRGYEIAAHTRNHPHLPLLSTDEELEYQIYGSREDLLEKVGVPVNNLAYPYGEYNSNISDLIKKAGFSGARTVKYNGVNSRSTDRYQLYSLSLEGSMTLDYIKSYLDQAKSNKKWAILAIHELRDDCSTWGSSCINPSTLQGIVDYLSANASDIDVVTIKEGLAKMNNNPVSDGFAPVVTQGDITEEATSASGANVDFSPIVSDSDSGLPLPLEEYCTIPNTIPDPDSNLVRPKVIKSGYLFPVGVTTVTCTAMDSGGNIGTKEFDVSVVDTTKPETTITEVKDGNNHTLVADEVTGSDSVSVAFEATDLVGVDYSECDLDDGGYTLCTSPKVYTNLSSGSHTVKVRSTDTAGNVESTAVFTWTVDKEAPVIEAHDDASAEATSNAGAVVTYTLPSVTDNLSTGLSATCLPASGSTFALGTTLVLCDAVDDVGNNAVQTSFEVNVVDTTKPVITLDGDNPLTLQAGSSYVEAGATVTDNYDTGLSATIDSSSVNVNALGSYSVTYNVTDSNGNVADEVVRTVEVIDTTKPEITILGDNPTNVEVGSGYVDAGATAEDNLDGDITGSIVTSDDVNTAVVGTYSVTYNVTDSEGNAATEETRTVNVVDTTKPVITLLGDTEVTIEVFGEYNDAGATANDNYDGDLTSSVVVTNTVLNSVVGDYTVSYNVTDANANDAVEVTRTVHVVDTTKPVIAPHDDIEAEATSHDGATVSYDSPEVTDNYDDAFVAVCTPSSGSVFALGETMVTCTAEDASGNDAEETTFKITVLDTTAPAVSVDTPSSPANANPSISFEVTDNTNTTTECKVDDGTYESCVSPFVPNIVADGEHTVTVRATDEGGNSTDATTDPFTTDATAPSVLITTGPADASFINYTDVTLEFSAEEGVALLCSVNGDSFTPCTPLTSLELSSLTDGEYTFLVKATDGVGNMATDSRTFTVDTVAPVVGIDTVASPTADSTPEISFDVTDTNVTTAECKVDDGEFTSCASPFTPSELTDGEHTVYVRATDVAGNTGEADSATFTVDTTAPLVEITDHPVAYGSVDDVSFTFTVNDEGALLECSLDGGDFAECESPIEYTGVSEGEHTFTIRATDELGHVGTDAFDFTVDQTPPQISLIGDATIILEVGDAYTEESAEATDDLDTNVEVNINSASVNTSVVGEYTVYYNASDDAGNAADEVTRTIKVLDTTKPVITLLGDNPMYVSVNTDYEEPGVNVSDNYDSGLEASTSGAVDTSVLGVYTIYYDAVDASGNNADQVSREVHVVDSMPPVITLLGENPLVLHVGDTFTDPGVSITDDVDGDISGDVVIAGDTVDTSTMGSYMVTYNVTDSSGNSATEVTRTVNVVPVIGDESSSTAGTTSITVTWTTDHPATSRVIYDTVSHPVLGAGPNYGYANSTLEDATLVTEHSVVVSGLSSGTTYYLRPVSHGSPETVGVETSSTTSNPPSGGGGGGSVGLQFVSSTQYAPNTNTNNQNANNSVEEEEQVEATGEVLGEETFIFTKFLKRGSKGEEVTELQKRLTKEGVYTGPITGYFGRLTQAAVKTYQKNHPPLAVDGIVGPKTRAVLNGN